MEQQLYSLSKLFTECLYRIPDYQRGYAWTEKHLTDFWSDLIQLERNKNHYLGVLTLEKVPEETSKRWNDDYWIVDSKSYSPYYVVDGQQRLTTSIILVQSIIESVNKDTMLNYTKTSEIHKKFIYDSKDEGISRSYMFGYEKDNPSYNFLKTNIFLEETDSSETPQKTIYTHNLEYAKAFFKKKLEPLSLPEKEDIYRKLTQNLLFNVYIVSTDIDVFVAFEGMNNRGKLLSYLELLKNRLIYLSTRFDKEDFEKNRLRSAINEAWKSMYHYLGKNKDKPLDDDLFLSIHFEIYFDNITSTKNEDSFIDDIYPINSRIHRRSTRYYSTYLLERKFTVQSIMSVKTNANVSTRNKDEKEETLLITEVHDYVKSLQSCVDLWYKILNPDDSEFSDIEKIWIKKLIRLSGSLRRDYYFSVAPLIMVFFQKEKKKEERIKFLKVLEKRLFLALLQMYKHSFFTPFYNLGLNLFDNARKLSRGNISSEKIIKELEDDWNKIVNDKDWLDSIFQEFKTSGFYEWRGIKYFLYEYDMSLQEKSKTEKQKLDWAEFDDYETIEHIYPQNPKRDCWTSIFSSYSTEQRKILKHSLGNLLPLSKAKNSSFSNKCFMDKISNNDNTVGYRYGSYSENEITRYTDWTAKEILERGLKLLDFMEKQWSIPLGGKDRKIDFLNLDFVKEQES